MRLRDTGVEELVTQTLRQIVRYLGFEGAVFYWHVPELGVLWPLRVDGLLRDRLPPLRPGSGLVGRAFTARLPAAADTRTIADRGAAPWHAVEKIRTLVALPLTAGLNACGIVAAYTRHEIRIDDQTLRVAMLLGNQLTALIRRTPLYGIAELQRYQIDALAEMVRAAGAAGDELAVFATVARHALLLTGADTVGIAGPATIDTFEGGYAGMPAHRRIVTRGRPSLSAHASKRPRTTISHPLEPLDLSLVVVWDQDFEPTSQQERLVEIIARYATTVIDNARSRAEIASRERRAVFLTHASNVLSSSLDLATVLRELERLAAPSIADAMAAELAPAEGDDVAVHRTRAQAVLADAARVTGAWRDAMSGKPARFRFPARADEAFASAVVVPMIAAARTVGALAFGRSRDRGEASDDDVRLYEEFALHGGAAIANALSFGRQREAADMLQRALLPPTLPRDDRMLFDAAYLPAGMRTRIGGDWYDAFRLDRDRLAISIGDVAGHGLRAAVTMNLVRQAFRVAALGDPDPVHVLARAHAALMLDPDAPLVTAVFAVIDLERRTLAYAAAGHPQPALVGCDGNVEFLPTDGIPLGIDYAERSVGFERQLADGETVVFYTDGLLEYSRNLVDGERRLRESLRAVALEQPRAMMARALHAAVFDGFTQNDDVAILSASLPVHERRVSWEVPARPDQAARLRGALRDLLSETPLAPARHFDFLLATGEAIVNAIEHAYDETSGDVLVRAEYGARSVRVEIVDRGRYKPPAPGVDRGRGTALMHALADDVTVSGGDEGTTVRLTFVTERG